MDATTALAIYRAEKDKALRERRVSHVQLMAEAQEAFRKMLADAQLARKGGRPKGSTNAPPPAAANAAAKAPIKVVKPAEAAPAKPVTEEKPKVAAEKPKRSRPAVSRAKAPAKKAAPKRAAEKRRATAKPARSTARSSGVKGSAKKTAPRRKQAASRERKPTTRKH